MVGAGKKGKPKKDFRRISISYNEIREDSSGNRLSHEIVC